MFKKMTTPKMVCTGLAFLIVGACQMSIPMTGQTNTGQAASGTVIADMSENNTLQINVGKSMVCRGLYNANNRSNVAVTCGNGVSGTAVVKPDADDLGGVVDFKLSDGTSGQVSTSRAGESVGKPSVDDKNKETVQQAQQPFLIQSVDVSIDSVGGASFSPRAVNVAASTIKYIHYKVTPYNAVGDVQSDSISGVSTKYLKDTGPYSSNQMILGGWTSWYNNTIRCFVIQSIKIEYMDGSEISYGSPVEVQKVFAPGEINSCRS